MRRLRPPSRVAPILLCLAASSVGASELWIEPSVARPDAGETVRIAVRGDRAERVTADVFHISKRFRRAIPVDGSREARLTTGGPGVELIAVEGSDPDGPVRRFAKAIVVVRGAQPGGTLHWSELGQGLELVPQSDPVVLARHGGGLTVQVLHDREPLAGVEVLAVPLGAAADARRERTDEIGLARFRLGPGTWRLSVSHDASCGDCRGGLRRLQASLTVPVGP